MKIQISNKQLVFLLMGFTMGNIFFMPSGINIGNKVWLAFVIGLLEGLIMIWIFTTLSQRFEDKEFIEILIQTFGKVIGKSLFFLFIIYSFHLGSLVIRNYIDFINITMMPLTPILAIGIVFLLACAYASYNGINVIASNSQILVPLAIVSVFFTVVLLFKDMELIRFKPFFEIPIKELLMTSHTAATFPFGETVVFLFIFPYVNKSINIKKSTTKGVIYASIIILITIIRDIAVLGKRISVATYPSAQAVRLINIANVITRLEVVVFFIIISMGFIKTSILLWCSSIGLGQLFNLKHPHKLVIPIAILMFLVAFFQFDSIMQNIQFIRIYPLYAPVFQVVIPALTLIVAKIRKII